MFLGLMENQGIVREFWFSFSVDTLGVVNVMVGLSVYKFAYCIRLVVHVQLFIISFVQF
jgi:hypothetical protein